MYNLTLKNFDIGIRLEYVFRNDEPDIQNNLDEYVYLQVSQNHYTWVVDKQGNTVWNKTKERVNMKRCEDGRVGLTPGSEDF